MHQVQTFIAIKAKIATLTYRIEALELQGYIQVNQVLVPMCNGCNALDHVMEECPFMMTPVKNGMAQVNTTYRRPIKEPYASIYNPRWRNHPNFS